MYRSYFSNKVCDYCKQPASMFRLVGSNHEYLCARGSCDRRSRGRAGFFSMVKDLPAIAEK